MDNTTPVGTWYLLANSVRLELQISDSASSFTGWIAHEGGSREALSDFSWDPSSRWLEFRRNGPDNFQWYRLSLTYGVVAGRFSYLSNQERPPNSAFIFHATGWSPDWIDDDIVPRTWHLTLNQSDRAVLRIDRDQWGALCGRLKVYAPSEGLEYGLTDIAWDGTSLSFVRVQPGAAWSFTGIANGRTIMGTFAQDDGLPTPWTGVRGEVLGFGLGSRLPQRAAWQETTRARIINLTEGMNLANAENPIVNVTGLGTSSLFPQQPFPAERDDNPGDESTSYTLQRLQFSFEPGSRFDPANPPPPRVYEGYLARPIAPPPPEGFRAVVAVNGHEGSAELMMTGSHASYWFGDSLARHGFVVLAIDIGHRPSWIYGPVFHPAIIDSNYNDSNWEETAERVFSVRRAIDWLLTQPNIRADGLLMTGLSMGGEVTTMTSALDERIRMVISAGYSPDTYVTDNHGNHPCYKWQYSDVHEFLDASDFAALIAPRPLVIETGLADDTYSAMNPHWASDKQVVNRAYASYGPDGARLIHYLHYDGHNWHAGDVNPTHPERPRGLFATAITGPIAPGESSWQISSETTQRSATLYTLIDEFLP